MKRKEELVTGEIYHVFNKSIAGFKIFNSDGEFIRILRIIRYYQIETLPIKFSQFIKLNKIKRDNFNKYFNSILTNKEKRIQIIAYCIMPTHFHLILKQLKENGISIFMGNILNSYSHYFNIKHKRKGPLWEGRFKNVLVKSDEQLIHLTRYIHLNPTSSGIVNKPEDWCYSSYMEYIAKDKIKEIICNYSDIIQISKDSYKQFVEDRVSYQRELYKIKHLILE